jgi:hypothetical protein
MLGHISNKAPNSGAILHNIVTHYTRTAFRCINKTQQQFHEGAFASAIGANQPRNARIEFDGETIKRHDVSVTLG